MKLTLLQIAPTKDANLLALEQEYEKRLQAFAKLKTITLPASKSDERARAQAEEKAAFLDTLEGKGVPQGLLVALDERGKMLTSPEFASFIQKERDFGSGHIIFMIGGSNGLHPDLLAKADYKLSFSKMTFTHEMIRPFLKEQLYRAFTILAGKRYHK